MLVCFFYEKVADLRIMKKKKKITVASVFPASLSCFALNMVNVAEYCVTCVKCFHKLCLKD